MFGVSHDDAANDFLRLAHVRPDRPGVALLGKLMSAFLRFPYENLTKIIRTREEPDPVKRLRGPEVVLGDHVDLGAGGTCFSLTYFFQQVIERCGFSCARVMCDRSYGPDTHCALVAAIEGNRYLVDPSYLMEHPLEMPARGTTSIATPFNRVTLMRLGATSQYLLMTEQGGKRTIRYRLKDIPVSAEVFRARWIDSFSWAQMRHLCVTKLGPDGHVYVRDKHLRHSTIGRRSQEKLKIDYEGVVERTFGIDRNVVVRARSYLHAAKQ